MSAPVRGAAMAAVYERRPTQLRTHITRRQLEALRHAAAGRTNAGIARRMDISVDTVSCLLQRAYKHLDARDRTHAVVIALRRELIRLDEIETEPKETSL